VIQHASVTGQKHPVIKLPDLVDTSRTEIPYVKHDASPDKTVAFP